jgi:hypothetical protein
MPEHDWTEKQCQYMVFIYNYSVIHGHSSVGSNIVLSDVPERKGDLVEGCYELPALEGRQRWRSRSSICWGKRYWW